MPPLHCCCVCYRFIDWFEREDTEVPNEIGLDYEVCDGTWHIVDQHLVGQGSITVKHSHGTPPFGWMQIELYIIPGVTYRIHAYQGDDDTHPDYPCDIVPDLYAELKCIDTNQWEIRLSNGDGYALCTDTRYEPGEEIDEPRPFTFCLSDDLQNTVGPMDIGYIYCQILDSVYGNPYFQCSTSPTAGKYFQIQVSGGEGKIKKVYYSEHLEAFGTPNCNFCVFGRCCYSEFHDEGLHIIGFRVEITGISSGACECSDVTFDVFLPIGVHRCQCANVYVLDRYTGTSVLHGLHDCRDGKTDVIVSMNCSILSNSVGWGLTLVPDDGYQNETQWQTSFPDKPYPSQISGTIPAPTSLGDGIGCNFDNATVTFTPYLVDGCCKEDIVELAKVLSAKTKVKIVKPEPKIECEFLEEDNCNFIRKLTGQPYAKTSPSLCKACLLCERPKRLNEFTISLIEDVQQQERAAQVMLEDKGAGSDLEKVFGLFAKPEKGCGCKQTKDWINFLTLDEIIQKKTEIVDAIASNAHSMGFNISKGTIQTVLNAIIVKRKLMNQK